MCICLLKQSTSPEDGVQDGRKCDSASDKTKCDRLLEQLLRILNSASHIGVGPDPGDLGKQYEQTVGAICSPSSGNAEPRYGCFQYFSCLCGLEDTIYGTDLLFQLA